MLMSCQCCSKARPNGVGYLVSKDDGTRLRTSVRQHLDFIRSRKKAYPKTSRSSSGSRSGGSDSSASVTVSSNARALCSSCYGSTLRMADWSLTTTRSRSSGSLLPDPGRSALSGLPHARAVIFQLREELQRLRAGLRPSELHLFMAMPGACALLLGHAWDRMPLTWTY